MPISKRTQLAQARRLLKRIEGDEPALHIRVGGFSLEEQRSAMNWFTETCEKQRAYVQQLETELADE